MQEFPPGTLVGFYITAWGARKVFASGVVTAQSLDKNHTTLLLHPHNEVRTIETHRLRKIEKPTPPPASPQKR